MEVVGQSFVIDVRFDDGCVLLYGALMDVNQARCFIKPWQGQSFKDVLSSKPLHRVYVEQNSNFPGSFACLMA